MKALTVTTLEQALQYWEDANLFGELMFQSRLKNLNPSSMMYVPLPASEASVAGWLARKIENYELLRKELRSGSVKDPSVYLPRIPKEYREKFTDHFAFLENQGFSFLQLPVHLAAWLRTKKVCRLTQEAEIPQIPLTESYLHLLPYDSFILYLNDPFVFNTKDAVEGIPELIQYYHTLLVSRTGNQISVYAIGDGLEDFCMEPAERNYVAEATRYAKQGKQKQFQQVMRKIFSQRRVTTGLKDLWSTAEKMTTADGNTKLTEADLNRAYNFTGRGVAHFFNVVVTIPEQKEPQKKGLFDGVKSTFSNLFKKESVKSQSNDGAENQPFFEILPEFLNGFCKLLSEAGQDAPIGSAVVTTTDIGVPEESEKEQKIIHQSEELMNWCDVPLGNVMDLRIEKDGGSSVKSYISLPSQKSPHVRRGHFRRYPQPDGSIKSVWINQVVVRKDKLESEQIKSGVMNVQ